MPYLGNEPAVAYTSTTKDSFSGDGSTTDFTMSKSANVNAVRVVVENVVQDPSVAYTCSGTTLSFTSAPPTGTNNIYVVHLGPPAATVAPPTTINNATTFGDGADIITASKGTDNVRLGEGAGTAIESGGNYNVAIGKDAGTALTTGDDNVAVGNLALKTNITGNNNVAVGSEALEANTGGNNTGVGYKALEANIGGGNNTALGSFALAANTTGSGNVAIGNDCMDSNTTASDNTAVGTDALQACTTGSSNTAVGRDALTANTTATTNTAVGANTLQANTTGGPNTAVGKGAMASNTTGSTNVAHGFEAMVSNTTASQNTAIGHQAGYSGTTGAENTYLGFQTGYSGTTSLANTMIGRYSGGTTTSSYNTFLGTSAGANITSGAKNTVIGRFNGNQDSVDIRTNDGSVILSNGDGTPVFWHKGNENANILAGPSGGTSWTGASGVRVHSQGGAAQWMTISNTTTNATSETMIVHRIGAVTNGEAIQFYRAGSAVGSITVSSGSTSFNTSSDYRLKENVSDLTGATERLKQLQPKKFSWIDDKLDAADTEGFLAHEVQEIVPKSVAGDKDEMKEDKEGNTVPRYQSIDHSKLVPLLTASLQEAIAKIETLETENTAIKARLDALEAG